VAGLADGLVARGADQVRVFESPALRPYLTAPYRRVVAGWIAAAKPALALFPSSTIGDDLAPAVAAELGAACVLDCDNAAFEGGALKLTRTEFDRKVFAAYAGAAGATVVATFKDSPIGAAEAQAGRSGEITRETPSADAPATALKVLRRDVAKKSVNLKDAKIIVAGGAGVGSAEGFALIKELAAALNAEIGATRAVVDAGWLPADHQIGQTGATVRPDVYIACGISGAVQHRVGMLDSRTIIAVNSDANAPIFKIAHYKLVGDLKAIVPKLVKLLKAG